MFAICAYPEMLGGPRGLSPRDVAASQRARACFAESAAERDGPDVIAGGSDLPSGHWHYRALQSGPAARLAEIFLRNTIPAPVRNQVNDILYIRAKISACA